MQDFLHQQYVPFVRLDSLTIAQSDRLQPAAVLVRATGHSLGGALVPRLMLMSPEV